MDELSDAISSDREFRSRSPHRLPPIPHTERTRATASNSPASTRHSRWRVHRAMSRCSTSRDGPTHRCPNRSHLIAVASAYGGYSLVLLGEGMCSAAHRSRSRADSPRRLFADAMIRFDTAVAAATRASDAPTLNLALLGRARTELDLGNSADAATDAALIPAGFEVDIDHDPTATRRQNLVFIQTHPGAVRVGRHVDSSTGSSQTHDPRIAVTSTGALGSDGHTVVWFREQGRDRDRPAGDRQVFGSAADHRRERREHRGSERRGHDHQRAARGRRPTGVQSEVADGCRR